MSAPPRRVVFRVDASMRIGGGHLMRCLSLADALVDRGAEVIFVCALLTPSLLARMAASGYPLERVDPPAGVEGDHRDGAVLALHAQRADATRTHAALQGMPQADWLVLDHYQLDHVWQTAVRSAARRLLVIDDLANRVLACDLLLDQTFARHPSHYDGLLPRGADMLVGSRYALLRPQFRRARPAAMQREHGPVRRVLISLGATDIRGVTLRALERALAVDAQFGVDVVLPADAQSLKGVRALATVNRRVAVHVDREDMASLLLAADLAVGAAGTSAWERCCLALPTVTLVLAENQREVAASLDEAGAALVVDDVEDVAVGVERLLADGAARARMSAAASRVTDGSGACRVADVMFASSG